MYQRHYSMKIGKDGNDLTTTAYNPIYLKGTISNGLFTPDTTTPYVFTKAACNVSGAYYMFVGLMHQDYYILLLSILHLLPFFV